MNNQYTENDDGRYREIRRVTLMGAVLDLGLGLGKIAGGHLGHSQALIADGVHSLSDLTTDAIVLWAARHGSRGADSDHPYGHERIQTAATVMLGVTLIAVAAMICYDAVDRMFHPELFAIPLKMTLVIAAISIISKEGIYHYTLRVARRVQSALLRANAWHSRSDALSSVVVFVGLGGTMAGLPYLDAVAAVAVAVMVAHVGWRLGWDALRELVDTGLDNTNLDNMRETMMAVQGVRSIHQLRTRRMGPQALADVHVIVDPHISVSEGHRIADEVEKMLYAEIDELSDVTVHVDPEEDVDAGPSSHLPLRDELLPRMRSRWEAAALTTPDRVVLHYLRGRIRTELWLRLEGFEDLSAARATAAAFERAVGAEPQLSDVTVVFY